MIGEFSNDINSVIKDVYPTLLIYATSLTKNPIEAEDLVQEALYRFLISYDKLNDNKQLNYKAWLCTVIRNHFFDTKRREKKKRNIDQYLTSISVEQSNETLLDNFINKSNNAILYKKILDLNYPYKDVLIFYYFFDMSIQTIATILNLKENNVKVILYRSKKKLKEVLQDEKL